MSSVQNKHANSKTNIIQTQYYKRGDKQLTFASLFAKSFVMWHKYTRGALDSCCDVRNYILLDLDCTGLGLSQTFVRGIF
jgi:hypothetical protein